MNDLILPNYRLTISRKPSEDKMSKRCSKKRDPRPEQDKRSAKIWLAFLVPRFHVALGIPEVEDSTRE